MNLLKKILLEFAILVEEDRAPSLKADDGTPLWTRGFGNYSSMGPDGEIDYTLKKSTGEITPKGEDDDTKSSPLPPPEPKDAQDVDFGTGDPRVSEPASNTGEDPNKLTGEAELLSADTSTVMNFAFGTKQSLKELSKERTEYGKKGIKKLSEIYGSRWSVKARASGEQLKLMGPNGTEEVMSAGEWAQLFSEMRDSKNVGAGTDASRAGEAATVYGMNVIIDEYKQNPENFSLSKAMGGLRFELDYAVNREGSLLDEGWRDVALSTVESIINDYGIENLSYVVWDTVEGAEVTGAKGHGTSADMFVKLNSGEVVGVSLKKNFNVFILNAGLSTVLEGIVEQMPDSEADKISSQLSMQQYFARRARSFENLANVEGFRAEATRMRDACISGETCPWKTGSTMDKRLKAGALESAFEKIDSGRSSELSIDEMKVLARIGERSNKQGTTDAIDNIRNLANQTLQDVFSVSVQNEMFGDLMKEKVVDGLHLSDTLNVGLTGIDRFVSYFGDQRFDNNDLLNYFVTSDEDKTLLKEAIDSGEKHVINKWFIDRIGLTYDEDSGKANINFRRTDNKIGDEPEYLSIGFAGIRERGIGTPPSFEMGISNEFKYILKYGPKISEWPTRARNIFKKKRQQIDDDVDEGGWDDPLVKQVKGLVRSLTMRELERINAS